MTPFVLSADNASGHCH